MAFDFISGLRGAFTNVGGQMLAGLLPGTGASSYSVTGAIASSVQPGNIFKGLAEHEAFGDVITLPVGFEVKAASNPAGNADIPREFNAQ